MAKIQAVWALDIGQAALKALKLVTAEAPGQVVAEAFDFVEYPKILSQPDADPDALVQEALRTFLDRNDLKGCKVAIAVPGQAGLVKFIKLPPVEKKRIPDIVKFEAKQQIPFALEEVIWDYQQIGGDGDEDGGFTMAEVGLFAMKRDQINRAILPFRAAGIEVDLVQMGPIALYNFAAFDVLAGKEGEDAKKDAGSVVLLDVGADNTDLIITDGVRIWQRNVPIGGNHFTRALTKELKLTFAKAEHLKRNATKAPDPRAVFTAMRGVFNDFASEVNRSIGFYSSVNRNAKIAKVVGLGNGFKLPGLQKFLQQNLSFEVEKLEGFGHLVGEDVTTAPQFQENLPSFAVAYGLGAQGLGISKLRTNLLPPEIAQTRLIRSKKPWVLAASALLMLGFSALFLGDYRALATVTSDQYKQAIGAAKDTAKKGADVKKAFDDATGSWSGKLAEGDALVPDITGGPSTWPFLFHILNEAMYDPLTDPALKKAVGHDLNPDDFDDREVIERTRVHIDSIKPSYVPDLRKAWFDTLTDPQKAYMTRYDQENPPPSQPGWVIQIVGHHYNPKPKDAVARKLGIDEGPLPFLADKVIRRLARSRYRVFGINNATIAWALPNYEWTGEEGAAGPSEPPPLLPRAAAQAGGGAGGMDAYAGGGNVGAGANAKQGVMPAGYGPGGGGGSAGVGAGAKMGYGGEYSALGGAGKGDKKDDKVTTRTRTDFLIQIVWTPPAKPPTDDELKAKAAELDKKMQEAAAKVTGALEIPTEEAFKAASVKASEKAIQAEAAREAAAQAAQAPAAGANPAAPAATPPGTPPAAPGTPPAAAPAAKK